MYVLESLVLSDLILLKFWELDLFFSWLICCLSCEVCVLVCVFSVVSFDIVSVCFLRSFFNCNLVVCWSVLSMFLCCFKLFNCLEMFLFCWLDFIFKLFSFLLKLCNFLLCFARLNSSCLIFVVCCFLVDIICFMSVLFVVSCVFFFFNLNL